MTLTPSFLRFNSRNPNTHHHCIGTACMSLTLMGDWKNIWNQVLDVGVAATSSRTPVLQILSHSPSERILAVASIANSCMSAVLSSSQSCDLIQSW
jgi:hypothetical protein